MVAFLCRISKGKETVSRRKLHVCMVISPLPDTLPLSMRIYFSRPPRGLGCFSSIVDCSYPKCKSIGDEIEAGDKLEDTAQLDRSYTSQKEVHGSQTKHNHYMSATTCS